MQTIYLRRHSLIVLLAGLFCLEAGAGTDIRPQRIFPNEDGVKVDHPEGSYPIAFVAYRALSRTSSDENYVTLLSSSAVTDYDINIKWKGTNYYDGTLYYDGLIHLIGDRKFQYGSTPEKTEHIESDRNEFHPPGYIYGTDTTHWKGHREEVRTYGIEGIPPAVTVKATFKLDRLTTREEDVYIDSVYSYPNCRIEHLVVNTPVNLNLTGKAAEDKITEWADPNLGIDGQFYFNDPTKLSAAEYSTSYVEITGVRTGPFMIADWDTRSPFETFIDPFDDRTPKVATLDTPSTTSKSFQKIQYCLSVTPNSPATIYWMEVFTPKDSTLDPKYILMNWTPAPNETESPLYAIDPLAIDPADGNLDKRDPSVDGKWEVQLLASILTVDANHDGKIMLASEDSSDATTPDKPARFTINDDADSGGTAPDYADNVVNGAEDLKDFFPVFLDLKQLITAMPPSSSVKYILRQENSAFNFVYTNLTRATAFDYKNGTLTTGFGPNFDQPTAAASTQQITAEGVELSAGFLDRILNQDQGVILVEGRASSAKPLVLSIVNDGAEVASVQLPLLHFDVHYDADNTTSEGYPNIDSGDLGPAERTAQRSSDIEKYPGVLACVNYYPITKNGVLGYAAGIDKFGNGQPNICGLFKPFLIEVASLEKYPNAKFVFDYAGSDPDQMTTTSVAGETEYVLPADGILRIWKKDGGEVRRPQDAESGGDYVSPSHGYTAAQLGWNGTDRYIKLYIEVVDGSDAWSLAPFNIALVNVEMFPDGRIGNKNMFTEAVDVVPYLLSYGNTDS